jgi:hypothetical protein
MEMILYIMSILRKKSTSHSDAYAPFSQKNQFYNVEKFRKKYSHVYLYILCARTVSLKREKNWWAVKRPKSVAKRLILVLKFIIFA